MTTGYRHGVYPSEKPTQLLPARTVDSNVVFAVGLAAVHTLAADKPVYVNVPRLFYSYDEFVQEMGWDDDNFSAFTLQELVYSHFSLYRAAPLVVVNVFDPATHQMAVDGESATFAASGNGGTAAGTARLGHTHVSNVVVKDTLGSTTYKAGIDYTLNAVSGVLTRVDGGGIEEGATVSVSYSHSDPAKVEAADIIGGIDVASGDPTGLELIDEVFPRYRLVPTTVVCPHFCEDEAVAVVMAAKCDGINGLFKAIALVDVPTGPDGVSKYTDVPGWKESHNLTDGLMVVCWPKVKLGDRVFGLATQLAGVISETDGDHEGIPYASPSNKLMNITSAGYSDENGNWKEVWLGLEKANYLNGQGVYTVSNFDGGMKTWGGRMACYPSNTDPKDAQDCIRRFFNWYQSTFILTYFAKVDSPLTRRFIQTILKSEQIRLDGYTSREILLGGSISFDEGDNPTTDLIDGICRFHTRMTPPPAARSIENAFEFDTDNLSILFS